MIGSDNQLLSDGTYNYTYDADGNEASKTNIATGDKWIYGYDNANHLVSAVETTAGGTMETQVVIQYGVFGNRLQEQVWTPSSGWATTRYAYDAWDPATPSGVGNENWKIWATLDGNNNLETRYINGDALDQVFAQLGAGGSAAWYLTDRLGSTRALVDNNGDVLNAIVYNAWGEITSQTNPSWQPIVMFAGTTYDAALGLYLNGNGQREYDPNTGRFLEPDPDQFPAGSSNLYCYVANSPTNATDPSGLLDAWEFGKGLLAGGGQGIADFFGGIWNLVWHPYDSVVGIYNGMLDLAKHLYNFEWDEATKQLFPELYQLATQWNNLSDYDKGYLIGKVVGQYGSGIATGAGIAKILKQLRAMKAAKKAAKNNCFPAGTLVATSEGLRPIETIDVDDLVWAYDLVSSQWRLCRVKEPFHRSYRGTFVYMMVTGETIASTCRHPYWVIRGEELSSRPWLEHLALIPQEATTPGRWVDSCDVRVGDEVLLRDGRIVAVESVELGPFEGTVYNMEVEELQCYTVGQNSVLVHNNSGTPTGPTLKPLHPDSSLSPAKLTKYEKLSTQELIDSLKTGQKDSLKIRPDGTMIDGHHRIKILRNRGVNVDALPREVIPKDPLP